MGLMQPTGPLSMSKVGFISMRSGLPCSERSGGKSSKHPEDFEAAEIERRTTGSLIVALNAAMMDASWFRSRHRRWHGRRYREADVLQAVN